MSETSFESWWAAQPPDQRATWLGTAIAARPPIERQQLVGICEARLAAVLRSELVALTGRDAGVDDQVTSKTSAAPERVSRDGKRVFILRPQFLARGGARPEWPG